jgi:hypothetical protein
MDAGPQAAAVDAGYHLNLLWPSLPKNLRIVRISKEKGGIMNATSMPKEIDRLLAEADEMIKRINSDAITDMEEQHRVQFETHAQSLKKLRSEVQEKIEKGGALEGGAYSEGMHQAIADIMTAMKNLGSYFS